ncbi:MAG: HNH endonuclease signature motif containing protein [Cetobacterium sp.]|uniref:HNH endonuclease signature motif containing protein n=1 Tax=Cetobacterium sp. TaxID=2071632 RepID=UPI003EE55462
MNHHITSFFDYDETSPSCLRWNDSATGEGKGSAERKGGTVAGSLNHIGWHLQVTVDGVRERTSASRVVWELHNRTIPPKHYVVFKNGDVSDCRISNLLCVDHSTLQHLKMWRTGKSYVKQAPSGRFWTMLRPHGYIGMYGTHEEAHDAYRHVLSTILEPLGLDPYP